MTGALAPRLVLVTRETEYDGLMARHATRGQAAAFLRRRAQSLDGLDAQRAQLQAMLSEIRAAVPKGWRIAAVRRAELDRFLFAPEDIVVAVGQDGLVANLAKYLDGQPVIGVNGDPARNPGVLVPHTATAAAGLLQQAAAGPLATEGRTMVRAELDDGQVLLALNEIFVGHASHQSARYSLTYAGREEAQSSSGLIVASGTGATGWALSISRATGVAVDVTPGEPAAVFLVREPWPSQATGTKLTSGRLTRGDVLLVVSRMNEGGVVFADGMETDRLDFAWGKTLSLSVDQKQLRFVPGAPQAGRASAAPSRPTAPVRRTARSDQVVPISVPPAPASAKPRQRSRRSRLIWLLLALLVAFWLVQMGANSDPRNTLTGRGDADGEIESDRTLNIVALNDRPDLAPMVAEWLYAEFNHAHGPSLEQRTDYLRSQTCPEQTFVLCDNEIPVATASLVVNDLPSRPDLTPWLASVLVRPEFRGRGYSAPLVRHVEAAAAPMASTLWLYTWTAEPLYARLGWDVVGAERDTNRDIPVVLMKRDLTGRACSP